MNKEMLYDNERDCKLCGGVEDAHGAGCPGAFIESLRYFVREEIYTRYGDHHMTRTEECRTLEQVYKRASVRSHEYNVTYEIVLGVHQEELESQLAGLRDKYVKEDREKEAIKNNVGSFLVAKARLDAERADLTDDGYARRLQAIKEKYKQ